MNDLTVENIFIPDRAGDISSDIPDTAIDPILAAEIEDDILEMNEDFVLDEFQVVRREFFAHLHEPAICFNNRKFYVNSACLQKFSNVDHVQVLVNQESKILALLPCPEDTRDSFMWCNVTNGKRKPKQMTCTLFFAKVFSMMDWNPIHRYKILGKVIRSNGPTLLAFDLTATEVYQRSVIEGEKMKTTRTPVFPAEWKNQFGLPLHEHRKAMQVNIFDGYAVYAIKNKESSKVESSVPVVEAPQTNNSVSHVLSGLGG